MAFVQAVTDQSSPQFVSPEARVATFDNDGTPVPLPVAGHPDYRGGGGGRDGTRRSDGDQTAIRG
jgi:hypothetical protein